MLSNRKIYESNLQAQLAQWKAEIDVLKAKAARAQVGVMVQHDRSIDALERKHSEASKRLHDLSIATDAAWVDLKAGTEKAWDGFAAFFKKAD